ncbi:hypothetical protein AB3Z07_15675 [Metabacillus halosaccharovorans]|uniref:hypothetical protein n=1 Tax=Metabacillus halosaccharovorans TaxID=930124 RepID=UPI00203FE74D|nr:hypothetical protein [Metabacillus halosaccharovorans]MCM3440618.1 hypothetical protein [Metabacillus halosaccharovorans]
MEKQQFTNEAISNLSKKIAELKKQGASGDQIQGAVFDMLRELGINIPLDKIPENFRAEKKQNE